MANGIMSRIKQRLKSMSFKTGVIIAVTCVVCYAISFGQMLLPLPAATKGVLWAAFFGLAKTFQYTALLILGKIGISRLKKALRLDKSANRN